MTEQREGPAGQGEASNSHSRSECYKHNPSATKGAAQGCTTEARAWIDFRAVNQAALCRLPKVLERWLPGGIRQGGEYTALNPTRVDRHLGSFRINIRTGRWADFATGDRGGDVISLAAYLFRLSQVEAARRLAGVVGMYRNERD